MFKGKSLAGLQSTKIAGAAIGCALAGMTAASAAAAPNPKAASGGASAQTVAPGIETKVSPSRFFSESRNAATFSFRVHSVGGPVSLTIRLVRRSDNSVIKTWKRKVKHSGWHAVHWDGSVKGKMQRDGSYAFRLTAKSADGASIRQAGGSVHNRVTMHNFAFPVHGSHSFGDGFGAPRSGHTHQGQDIMASCGTPIVAARAGTVKKNDYQSAAGNYLVVSADGTGEDFVYMHMPRRSNHQEGQRVYTGQQIGIVGQSGDATACHLHFEMWSSPGWYSGGSPFDPRPSLDRWDRYS